jgi:hypothetical protein
LKPRAMSCARRQRRTLVASGRPDRLASAMSQHASARRRRPTAEGRVRPSPKVEFGADGSDRRGWEDAVPA